MGYSTYYSGKFSITPSIVFDACPTPLDEILDEKWFNDNNIGHESDWVIDPDEIYHNGVEKSYEQLEWLELICKKLRRNNYLMNGKVIWSGEHADDTGLIWIKDGVMKTACFKDLIRDIKFEDMK